MTKIEKLLISYPTIADFQFSKFKVKVMREAKKPDYYGTSVKRFKQLTNHTNESKETWDTEGYIYLNLRDIESEDKLLRIIAEETSHLTINTSDFREELYQYLKGELCGKQISN